MAADTDHSRLDLTRTPRRLGALRLQRLRQGPGEIFARYLVVLMFSELLLFGGDRPAISLAFAALELLSLALLVITASWARAALLRLAQLDVLGPLFLGLLAWTALQMAPIPNLISDTGWAHAPGQVSVSIAPFSTLTEFLELAGLGAVFIMALAVGRDDDRAHAAWNTFGGLAALYAAWAMIQHVARLDTGVLIGARLTASLANANSAGCLFAIFVVVGWTAVLRTVVSLHRDVLTTEKLTGLLLQASPWFILVLLSFAALSLTGSRGAAVAVLAGLITSTAVMAWSELSRRRTFYFILGAAGVIASLFVFLVLSSGAVATRLAVTDAALSNRSEIIGIYLSQLARAPWNGFGLGTFRAFNNLLMDDGDRAVLWNLGALHNVYLQWIFESGWPGAALMFSTISVALVSIFRGLKRRRFGRTWIAGALAISAVVLTHGLIDFALQLPGVAGLWTLALGIGLGVSRPSAR